MVPGATARNSALPAAARARLRPSPQLFGLRPNNCGFGGSGVTARGTGVLNSTGVEVDHARLSQIFQPWLKSDEGDGPDPARPARRSWPPPASASRRMATTA